MPKSNQEDFHKALVWAKEPEAGPTYVRDVILSLEEAHRQGNEAASKRAVEALARAMGIIPSSEKEPKRPPESAPPLDTSLAKLLETEKQQKALLRYVSRQLDVTRRRIAEVMKEPEQKEPSESQEEPVFSGESILVGRGAGSQDAPGNDCPVAKELKKDMGKGTIETDEQRFKQDLVLGHMLRRFNGQKLYNPSTGKTAQMDLSQVGPSKKEVTWRALANIVVLVFGMALPLSRIEKMFGKRGFARSTVVDHIAYVAERLLPSYVAMASELAACEVLQGDDCVSRVTEITRYNRDFKIWQSEKAKAKDETSFLKSNPEPKAPWKGMSPDSLTMRLADELDFTFAHFKKGSASTKVRLHTSVLSGEVRQGDTRSRVILYRSHLGSVGNLLSRILLSRKPSHGPLVFVGDLSSSNFVTDKDIEKKVSITYAGCTSHARRPFKRHFDQAPDDCLEALDYFRALFHIEELIEDGRQASKEKIRKGTGLLFWNDLKTLCEGLSERWSPSTALGEAAQYVLGNFDALTLYCKDMRLPLSNDLSERLLRYEKLMDRSSFGRETIEGRVRYDIVRSFWQSCVAAQVDPTFALLEVMLTKPSEVSSRPADFTPQAIAKRLASDRERCAHLDRVLNTSNLASLVTYKVYDPNMPREVDEL